MADVACAAAATAPADGDASPSAALEQKKRKLEQLLQQHLEWTQMQQCKLQQKRELEALLGLNEDGSPRTPAPGDAIAAQEPRGPSQPQQSSASTNASASSQLMHAPARRKELRQLQQQAAAVLKKQQETAAALAHKLEQLNSSKEVSTKRKRDESDIDSAIPATAMDASSLRSNAAPARSVKRPAIAPSPVALVPPKHQEFARAPEALTTAPTWERSALFRVATRHFLQTGQRISPALLAQQYASYSGASGTLSTRTDARAAQSLSTPAALPRTSEASRAIVRWCPGAQSLAAPTVDASESNSLRAFLGLEKRVVESVCRSIERASETDATPLQRIQDAVLQSTFVANLARSHATGGPAASIYAVLADAIGRRCARPTSRTYRQRQFAEQFVEMETWLEATRMSGSDDPDTDQPHSSASARCAASVTMTTPFDLEHDSVLRQVRSLQPTGATPGARALRRRKKLDPMNMLCLYELSGVCNDENCRYQHQRDFDETADASDSDAEATDDSDSQWSPPLLSREQTALLHDFAHVRAKVSRKWPVVTGVGSAVPEHAPSAAAPTALDKSETEPPDAATHELPGEVDSADDADFLALDALDTVEALDLSTLTLSNSAVDDSARYCHATATGSAPERVSIASLEATVARDPVDTDAWLLLAILQLDFEVRLSDDTTRVSDSARVLEQLTGLYRCVHLRAFAATTSSTSAPLDERKLKQSLHTLSRAIEVEANAYCEALWLLYLHLSALLATRDVDGEFEMSEHAIQFIPSSHRLWLHYLSVAKLESIDVSERLHARVLRHLLESGVFQSQQTQAAAPPTNLSALLLAIVLHLCIKLHRAGRTHRALDVLAALLQLPASPPSSTSSSTDWCSDVRAQLDWCDLVTLALVYAHVLLFHDVPRHVHAWLHVSGDHPVQTRAFAFTREQLVSDCAPSADLRAAMAAYKLAFMLIDQTDDRARLLLDVVVTNRVVLSAHADSASVRSGPLQSAGPAAEIEAFVREHRAVMLQVPSACFTAAHELIARDATAPLARDLLRDLVRECPDARFPEALHVHLRSQRRPPLAATAETRDAVAIDVVARLAASVRSVDTATLAQSIAAIASETNPFARAKALKRLLFGLLTAWMDNLAAASRAVETDASSALASAVDVYVALDICELLRVWLKPATAIEALELVLQSSKFTTLSADARQLAWSARFILHMDASKRAHDSDGKRTWSSRSMRTELQQLYRRYMERMSAAAEATAHAMRHMAAAVHQQRVQAAILECLFPQHSAWLLLDDNVALFELCAAATPSFELPSFYSACHCWLAPSPRFCLAYADVATHHWEWRQIRQALRQSLDDPSTRDTALRALVALELAHENVKGVAKVLDSALHADPLSIEAWRLVLGMEIVFGRVDSENEPERVAELVAEVEKRKLTVRANAFNDHELVASAQGSDDCQLTLSTLARSEPVSTGVLCGRGLHCVPNAVLLLQTLTTLDLRCNFLVSLPDAIAQLSRLEVLDVSQNALVALPPTLAQLTALRVLNVAHNNVSAIPGTLWVHLTQLQELDLSANVITHLPAPPLARLAHLRVLRFSDNVLSSENVAQLQALVRAVRVLNDTADSVAAREVVTGPLAPKEGEKTETAPGDAHEKYDSSVSKPVGSSEEGEAPRVAADAAATTDEPHDDEQQPQAPDNVEAEDAEDASEDEGEVVEGSAATTASAEQDEQATGPQDTTASVVDVPRPADAARRGDGEDHAVAATAKTGTETHGSVDRANHTRVRAESCRDTHSTEAMGTAAHAAGVFAPSAPAPVDVAIFSGADFLSDTLEASINENRVSRAHVKQHNPVLWRQYVERQVPFHSDFGSCVLCDAPNAGWNQRLNTMVLCPSCLQCAVDVVRTRAQSSSSSSSSSRQFARLSDESKASEPTDMES